MKSFYELSHGLCKRTSNSHLLQMWTTENERRIKLHKRVLRSQWTQNMVQSTTSLKMKLGNLTLSGCNTPLIKVLKWITFAKNIQKNENNFAKSHFVKWPSPSAIVFELLFTSYSVKASYRSSVENRFKPMKTLHDSWKAFFHMKYLAIIFASIHHFIIL